MKMDALVRYGLPGEVIGLWKKGLGETLLPVQELAVRRHDLFEGGNLLIQAPTSSGKTFIGEMAATETALRRKKVIYLVPLKALAEEKYEEFRGKYEAYGIDVIISSRDHRQFDKRLEEGDFSIAVVVYEKLAQVLVRRPERLAEIALVVADELEILSDEERGGTIELLLTAVLRSGCRMIGLSAVIGGAEELASWMGARLVSFEQRPIELRYGVLHEGLFKYRTYNGLGAGEERLIDAHSESTWETLTQNVCAFVDAGETCLIFVKAKQESRRAAELLAERVETPAAGDAIEALRDVEPTRSQAALLRTLTSGVAFHNADLSPAERRAVEEGFRSGAIRVVVSTGTLAVGLNMPAQNVFITTEKWRYDKRFGMPWKAPISRSEYENMGGRAGRYGSGQAFGRSILIAATPFDEETFWRRYVEGDREPIEPRLARESLENYALQLVASKMCGKETELIDFLEGTLSGEWIWREVYTLEEVSFHIRAAVNRAADGGMLVRQEGDRLVATPLGLAVASKGLSMATAKELEEWIGESEGREWSEVDLMLAAAMTPDGRMYGVSLTGKEYEHAGYVARLKRLASDEALCANVPLNRIRNCNLTPFFEEMRSIKVALFLERWIDQMPFSELEEGFETMAGQILVAADQVAWIVDGAAAIAGALGASKTFVDRIRILAERVQRGLREEALPLGRLQEPGPSRSTIATLVHHGMNEPERVLKTTDDVLRQWLTAAEIERLRDWAYKSLERERPELGEVSPDLPSPPPILKVDDRHPGEIAVDGATVHLQDKQYRLIRLLAQHPNECVGYDDIYSVVWGEAVVESGQMHYQKQQLLKRIRASAPEHGKLIKTVSKRGFKLCAAADRVTVYQLSPATVEV